METRHWTRHQNTTDLSMRQKTIYSSRPIASVLYTAKLNVSTLHPPRTPVPLWCLAKIGQLGRLLHHQREEQCAPVVRLHMGNDTMRPITHTYQEPLPVQLSIAIFTDRFIIDMVRITFMRGR